MRRLLAWGRQDPLCPAEAASPPPLSAFHSPCSVLPTPPSKHFSDIERQLSARIAAEPLLLRSAAQQQQQQPSPPTEAANERTSPPEPTPIQPPTVAPTTQPNNAATANSDPIFSQQQQQQQRLQNAGGTTTQSTAVGHQQQPPKGIDAFFAALACASRENSGGGGPLSATSSHHCQQQSRQITLLEPEQPNPRRNSFVQQPPSIVPRLSSSEMCAQQQLISQQLSAQPLSQKIQQQVANTALSANLLVTALAAQQQQQHFQRHQNNNEMPSIDPSLTLFANLKASTQPPTTVPLLPKSHPLDVQRYSNIPNASSIDGSTLALNAFQLVQQTANLHQQKMIADQQQQQLNSATTMVLKSPLSPQNAVFAGSEVGIPALISRLSSVPAIFRSVGPGPNQSKPIPLDERVDLLQFKRKEPREWSSDDVVAWILNVGRRHQIPCENLNLAKFANCTGPLLMLMNEQSFKEHDPNYGSLLFSEFCKLVTDEDFIDEWMKVNGAVAGPSSASNHLPLLAQMDPKKPAVPNVLLQQTALLGHLAIQQEKRQQQRLLLSDSVTGAEQPMGTGASVTAGDTSTSSLLLNAAVVAANSQQQQAAVATGDTNCALSSLNHLLLPAVSSVVATESILQQQQHSQQNKLQMSPINSQLQSPPHLLDQSSVIASLSRMIMPIQQQQQQQQLELSSTRTGTTLISPEHQQQHSTGTSNLIIAHQQRSSQQYSQHTFKQIAMEGTKRGVGRPAGSKNKVEKQIKRNKDGKPRKRSQHTKGNKLWEFIRDALKDPRTCPSVVRWEDPTEGVFRIVESEQLAFLWGQKKNNQKMTYEKLSRAMRTYYEKEILVPVPKSGLYPKKLVYKFGPTAHGWRAAASLAVQAHLALIGGPSINR